MGLLDAFRKFDPAKKVQFRSYAQFRIRGAILDSLRTLDWSPRDLRRKGRAVEEAMRRLTARWGGRPRSRKWPGRWSWASRNISSCSGELKGLEIGTLHLERSEDSGEEELAYIPNHPEDDPLFRCLRGEMQERLAGAIDAAAGAGAAGGDALLLRRDDDEGDRPRAGGGRIAGLADSFLGGGAPAGAARRNSARGRK